MRVFVFVLGLLLSACQSVTAPVAEPPDGEIVDLRSGQLLSAHDLVERLADIPRVIVGEQHDNPEHHQVQLWLLQALAQQRAQGSLLLEMLTEDQQVAVDRMHATASGQWPEDLPQALSWQSGWDWSLYGPIVRYALAQPYPMLAANLTKTQVGQIYRQPPVMEGQRSTAPAVSEALLTQIRQSHCGMLPESQMAPMLAVQQQRDRHMAERLLAAPAPAMLLAGAYHARLDIGVPLHVQDLGAKAPRVLILAQKGDVLDAGSADYAWYTVARPAPDYCAQMRQ